MTGASAARRSTGTHAPSTVLFVCTANISRSPYAERRARQVLPDADAGITFASAGTREVAWELRFAPDTPYRYPGGGFHFRTVTNTPLPDGDVLVQWTTPFQPFAACQVTLDDQVIGYTFSNRAVLRTPAPGRHRLAVRVAWYDGTLGPPLEAEIDIPDHG